MRLRALGRWMRVRPVDVGDPEREAPAVKAAAKRLRGSLQLRHVDAGSCNGCEMEIAVNFSPIYDAERFGIRLEASPRHADGLLVTGPVTRNMAGPLRKTFDALPRPRVAVAVGDGAATAAFAAPTAWRDRWPTWCPSISRCPAARPDPAITRALRGLAGT